MCDGRLIYFLMVIVFSAFFRIWIIDILFGIVLGLSINSICLCWEYYSLIWSASWLLEMMALILLFCNSVSFGMSVRVLTVVLY